MSNYSVMLFRFEPVPSESSYSVNVFLSGTDGRGVAALGRSFTKRDEFVEALNRLGISFEKHGQVLEVLAKENYYHIHHHPLSDEIAAEFGWPPK